MRIISLLALLLFLSACQATVEPDDPKITIERDEITIEGDDGYDRDGEFCPPGHAKKGWC